MSYLGSNIQKIVIITCVVLAFFCLSTTDSNAQDLRSFCDSQGNGFHTERVDIGGVIVCVKNFVQSSSEEFIWRVSQNSSLIAYRAAVLVLALVLFGMRITTFGSEDILKESLIFIIKASFIFWIIGNLTNYSGGYDIYGKLNTLEDEMLRFVSPSNPGSCYPVAGVVRPVDNYALNIFNKFSCMMGRMLGLTYGSMTPQSAALFAVVAIAAFSNVIGLCAALFAVSAFITVVLMLFRAAYAVLLAYVTLAFLMVFAPIFLPLYILDVNNDQNNKAYVREVFERWLAQVVGTLLQPLFLVAFLTMAAQAMNTFIEDPDNILKPNCVVGNPSASGVCPYVSLFNTTNQSLPQVTVNSTVANIMADVQDTAKKWLENQKNIFSKTYNCIFGTTCDGNLWDKFLKSAQSIFDAAVGTVYNTTSSTISAAFKIIIDFITFDVDKEFINKLEQLVLTLTALIITTWIMYSLLSDVEGLSAAIADKFSLTFLQKGVVPFENQVSSLMELAGKGIKSLK